MEVVIKGRNVEVNDRLRGYVERKVSRLARYLPTIDEARMELTVHRTRSAQDRQVAQLTVRDRGTILRAEERSSDLSASIDTVLDKMYRQVMRYKGKRYRGRPQARPMEEPLEEAEDMEFFAEEPPPHIVRTKRFPTPPMDEEEAIEQMELLGHDFFVFLNAESGEINVLYRRRDGDYGLIIPEPA
jgi:putative sigma-54 modulation protein